MWKWKVKAPTLLKEWWFRGIFVSKMSCLSNGVDLFVFAKDLPFLMSLWWPWSRKEGAEKKSIPDSSQSFLHPWKLTWNLTMKVWKMVFLLKQVIFRFHVNFPGCTSFCFVLVICCVFIPSHGPTLCAHLMRNDSLFVCSVPGTHRWNLSIWSVPFWSWDLDAQIIFTWEKQLPRVAGRRGFRKLAQHKKWQFFLCFLPCFSPDFFQRLLMLFH